MTTLYTLTGYPRSRTAWLANWLTWGRSWCYHEASRFAKNEDSYRSLMNLVLHASRDYEAIGNSDSALLLHLDWIPAGYPLVVVRRPESEVLQSLSRLMGTKPAKTLMERLTDAMKKAEERASLVVDFADLGAFSTLARVWEACLPDQPMPKSRTVSLMEMNVQVPIERRREEAEGWAG